MASHCVNPDQTRSVKALKSRVRVALTGTPIENSVVDLWSLFDFLNPGLLGSAQRFGEAVKSMKTAGFAPLPMLELEVGLARGRDHESSPDTRLQGVGFAAKWVPLQAETGLSAGVKVEHARARADDRVNPRVTGRANALSLLASWRFASEQVIHFNAGREWVRVQGDTEATNTWGVGFEQPLTERLQLVAEVFGAEESRPDRQIGLRYEIMEGLKVSAAVGRGSDRSIANAGISWEF